MQLETLLELVADWVYAATLRPLHLSQIHEIHAHDAANMDV